MTNIVSKLSKLWGVYVHSAVEDDGEGTTKGWPSPSPAQPCFKAWMWLRLRIVLLRMQHLWVWGIRSQLQRSGFSSQLWHRRFCLISCWWCSLGSHLPSCRTRSELFLVLCAVHECAYSLGSYWRHHEYWKVYRKIVVWERGCNAQTTVCHYMDDQGKEIDHHCRDDWEWKIVSFFLLNWKNSGNFISI